jgi:hypothetical protein
MNTRQFTKGDTIAILATARKNIDDNLRPAIDLLQLGTRSHYWQYNRIRIINLLELMRKEQPIFSNS